MAGLGKGNSSSPLAELITFRGMSSRDPSPDIHVLSVASEIFPLVKTGGLADVAGALPAALDAHNVDMVSLVPGYPAVLAALDVAELAHVYASLFGGPARVLRGYAGGAEIFVLDAPLLFDRAGNPYLGPDGKDWPDNARRFAALSRVGADLAAGLARGYRADILHCHDWQAGLGPVYARFQGGPKTLLTVHNIAFKGEFPASDFAMLGLPAAAFDIDGIEYHGGLSYLKGGIASADLVTTVSPSYAREICTPEYGMGLDGLLRSRRADLRGIVNGIDYTAWNPATDPALRQTFTARTLERRSANKRAVEERFDLERGDGILHGVVSRLTEQKGMDLLADSLDYLVSTGARLALIGTGEPECERALRAAADRWPGRIGIFLGYDEELAHLVHGGCDTLLVPSRFEPCGLTQLSAMRYGCLPITSRTGGLADTVIGATHATLANGVATGFQLASVDRQYLEYAFDDAAACFADPDLWQHMQNEAMTQDLSWNSSAGEYARLYRGLLDS